MASAARHRSAIYTRGATSSTEPIPAPLVFSRASVFDEARETPVSAALGVPSDELRHAGHEWVVSGPLMSGSEYTVSPWTLLETSRTTGGTRETGSEHRFSTFARSLTSPDGCRVQEERMTVVSSSNAVPSAMPNPGPAAGPVPSRGNPLVKHPAQRSEASHGFDEAWLEAPSGTVVAEVDLGELSRTDIVRFAGAIGDFTAIHHDVEAARRAGLQDVIAMGMLSAAMMLAPIETVLGPYSVRACSIRFRRSVYPGEALGLVVQVEDGPGRGRTEFDLQMKAASIVAVTGRLTVENEATRAWQRRWAP